ncbi:AMP-dependent synthetase/ligase [Corchorus capsularis]|uniref:AMP-dependent synthetase/ligase n=1 Tax=Corchorus capsularis TaxID=210143 RepID=A0A1R3IM16_COCAP|nr:AMP-dependent synthetase/ligase [Corchorus capsularis]
MLGRRQTTDSKACNSQAITYVPLYDTLGANAVEFIINHAEVSIAFVQENKLPAVSSHCNFYLLACGEIHQSIIKI